MVPWLSAGKELGARSKQQIRQGDKADQFKLILNGSPIYASLSKNPEFFFSLHILLNSCQPVSSISVTSAKPQTCSMRSFYGLDCWNPSIRFPGTCNCPQTGRAAGLLTVEPSGDGPLAEGGDNRLWDFSFFASAGKTNRCSCNCSFTINLSAACI